MRVKLEDVCERGSSNLKLSDIQEMSGEYPIYGASGYIGNANFYHQEQAYVAVIKDGAGIGRTTLHPAKSSVIGTMQYLIPKDNVLPEYLFYVVSYMHLEKYFTGATIPHIYFKDYKNEKFNLDPLEKQTEIVNVLGRCEKIIEIRKQELQKLDKLIKARFVEVFGSIHEDRFPKCLLREVAHIKHGYAFSGEFFSEEDNGVVLVTPGNFAIGGGFQEQRNKYFTAEYPEEYVLHAGDLIVTMTDLSKKADTLGYGAIVPDTGKTYLHNQRIGLFDKLDKKFNPIFVRWYMQTSEYRLEIVRTSTGSTVHHTSPDRILNSIIFIPPIELQNEFADFVRVVNKSKVAVQKSLDETQLLFDSLMQKYFG